MSYILPTQFWAGHATALGSCAPDGGLNTHALHASRYLRCFIFCERASLQQIKSR